MKRLTNARNRCVFCKAADEECAFAAGEFSAPCPDYKTYQRLSAIEDILGDDYDLDRLKDLVQADREGRCAKLPCKEFFSMLGGDVYAIDDDEVLEVLLYGVGYDPDGIDFIDAVYAPGYEDEKGFTFRFSDVGKTIFLTREEAEAVLQNHKDQEKLPEAYQHQIMSRFCRKD